MAKRRLNFWTVVATLLTVGLLHIGGAWPRVAVAQYSSPAPKPSWGESISSSVKSGFDKVGSAFTPKKTPASPGAEDDAVSLKGKAKPGPDVYVAMARLFEQSGKLADAEQQYQLALKEKPDSLPALLGYAQLKEHLGKPEDALRLYDRAVKSYPREASVHNNQGLCYSRLARLDEAAAALGRAVQLDPRNPLYRNNIATVLVDQGKSREAFEQLRQVHGDAVAYYNLGYLLNKKGQTQAAIQHFALALRVDPSMDSAKRWMEYLERSTAQARLPKPMDGGVRVMVSPSVPANAPPCEPSMEGPMDISVDSAPMPPDRPLPRRLPPVSVRESTLADDARVRAAVPAADRGGAPLAPLPPVQGSRPVIEPLPPVK